MAKRTGRKKSQLPDCYHEGYLEKKSTKDQVSQKLWTCLCGNTLFFYNDKRDNDYVDKVALTSMTSVSDDHSKNGNLDFTRFNVMLKTETITFSAPNPESRELWKGFIHSVAQLSVPSSLNLLPGHVHMLEDTVKREKERLANIPPTTEPSPSPASQSAMPACFYGLPRLEAELLLEREADKGNLLLRPAADGKSFAITTRLDLDGSVFKHYRVLSKDGCFYIDVDNPVRSDTLQGVIDFLVEKTSAALTPLIIEPQYDKNISFVSADNENGEKTHQALPTFVPLVVPRQQGAVSFDEKASSPEVRDEDVTSAYERNEEDVVACAADEQNETPKKILTTPCPAPRKKVPRKLSSDAQKKLPLKTISELEHKLLQRRRAEDANVDLKTSY